MLQAEALAGTVSLKAPLGRQISHLGVKIQLPPLMHRGCHWDKSLNAKVWVKTELQELVSPGLVKKYNSSGPNDESRRN